MRTRAFLLALVLAAACKGKPAQKQPPPSAETPPTPQVAADASAGSASTASEHPQAPTAGRQPVGEPLSLDDAAKLVPKLAGKEILALRQTSDKRQVHATWCIDGTGADDVAQQVGKQMAAAGYKDLSIRGDAKKSGVQGARDGFRMSMIVSASSAANCPAPQHYFASATFYREPLAP